MGGPKRTKIIQPKLKKLKKNIATFEDDGLFFFDSEDSHSDDDNVLNDLQMVAVKENVNEMIAAKNSAEQILLRQREKMRVQQMNGTDLQKNMDEHKKENGI